MTPTELRRRLAELEPLCVARHPGAQDLQAMNARVERMRLLYQATCRDNPDHSMHGLLTGLHLEAQQLAPF
jgi:hypothetical protein